jgi:hypothetical protein
MDTSDISGKADHLLQSVSVFLVARTTGFLLRYIKEVIDVLAMMDALLARIKRKLFDI